MAAASVWSSGKSIADKLAETKDKKELDGKVAIVTGASRGIGAAIAKELGRLGANVIVNYNKSEAEANEVVEDIVSNGSQALAVKGDISMVSTIRSLFQQAIKAFGGVDIVVNNASVRPSLSLEAVSEPQFQSTVDANFKSVFFALQESAKHVREHGRIISISSNAGSMCADSVDQALYFATKAAVSQLTKHTAALLGPKGITVNVVEPGLVDTDSAPANAAETAQANTFLKRVGTPQEVADVVAFLCSKKSRYVTGSTVNVSGGLQ